MIGELIQVADTLRPMRHLDRPDTFTVPLIRAANGTAAADHEAGLWVVMARPVAGRWDLEVDTVGVAFQLPALTAEATKVEVSYRVGRLLDVGYQLLQLRVVE